VDSADRFPFPGALVSMLGARAAHDLNNLIAIVGGHLYLLRQPGASTAESLDAMATAVSQLELLSKSLARLGALDGRNQRPLAVNELVRRAAERSGRANLLLDLEEPLPRVVGSDADLSSALDELIQTAAEASEPGRSIRISTRRLAGAVALSVEDSGKGIAPAIAGRVFDPFFSTKPGRGAGVGLFLVAIVAAAHGTSCRLEPREGGGTVATLRFPATLEE
jgi:signal transduction histidine kinase